MTSTVNYQIAADIVDIRKDSPVSDEKFLVDSNVWLWMTYTNIEYGDRSPQYYQTHDYPDYIGKVLAAEAFLHKCSLSFSELAHIIEKVEREIYQQSQGQQIGTKTYRHNYPALRNDVLEEIEGAWGAVKSMASPLEISVCKSLTDTAVNELRTKQVDAYDLFILEAMKRAGVTQIITDDGDFATVSDIKIFTANRNVISLAKQQGKLITR
ncbi:MAG: PIN domain-containing protein [Sedimentisphaerales bacterium]|nr:PIN domain-containing protein [Sedimentisphaerales bacterium]